MSRSASAIALALLLAVATPVVARDARGGGRGGVSFRGHGGGRGGHGGHHGHHGHHHGYGSRFSFYGSYGPYWYPGWGWYRPYFYSYYPYYPYYPYYYPAYTYPPPWAREPDDEDTRSDLPPSDEMDRASYGLLRLDGVRDGAAVELDGRFWLTAQDLDDRWLALPQGEHRIAVRVGEGELMERTVRIVPGRTHVLKFDTRTERRS